jgi:hypothetical protein
MFEVYEVSKVGESKVESLKMENLSGYLTSLRVFVYSRLNLNEWERLNKPTMRRQENSRRYRMVSIGSSACGSISIYLTSCRLLGQAILEILVSINK